MMFIIKWYLPELFNNTYYGLLQNTSSKIIFFAANNIDLPVTNEIGNVPINVTSVPINCLLLLMMLPTDLEYHN